MNSHASRTRLAVVLASLALALPACNRDAPPPPEATSKSPDAAPPTKRVVGPLSEADAAALATMNDRLQAYFDVHRKIEGDLPKLGDDATPQEIDKRQRLFEQKIREARKDAQQGDIFTPEAQAVIKRLLASVFEGPEGRAVKATVLDENPAGLKLTVNMRYPDTVPVSTMPPEVLQTLPKLAEDMEYRFIGRHLIILDAHAHVVADFVPDAIPE